MTFNHALPTALSPSRLQDFQACPRRFQYASIERIAQPATYATAKGRFAHYVFEHLFKLEPDERTIERARGFVSPAQASVLDERVREDLAMDEAMFDKMTREVEDIIVRYFKMEEPTTVRHEGVELRLSVEVEGVPMLGILDRLDRAESGELVIVDYKTGSLPNRDYDTKTFANTELYAALCEAKFGERPLSIRLLYVAHGQAIERRVSDVVVRARTSAAVKAWERIHRYYDEGAFPATPSLNTCRFCAYQTQCRASGVSVPTR